uniref:Alpha-(1,6)-fucosyltransferase N- and catalytic domain-containing protein n=1 Tax=Guillardia theta TaxID=55529 RepID=A0A7S4PIV9_GUITH|mmetsp:Transcript_51745/g.161042  ORF Transcript_51745/g.161042 Transcript_51745/m.161042 type:complete len:311 (+) Transcript_51745:642-1574(+)
MMGAYCFPTSQSFRFRSCAPKTNEELQFENCACYFEPLFSGLLFTDESQCKEAKALSSFWRNYLPPEFISDRYGFSAGILWWNIALIQYLLAPNHRLETMISRYKTIMGWGRDPVIGVHVRRGDACAGWRNGKMHHAELMPKSFCLDVEKDVVPAIKLFSRVYSTKSVFISTDDPNVLTEIRNNPSIHAQLSEVQWMGVDVKRNFLQSDTNYDLAMRIGVLDRRLAADSALLDLFLLRECDYLILQLSGEFSRLALELNIASKGYLPPFISLDTYSWAPRYGLAHVSEWWVNQSAYTLEDLVKHKEKGEI